MPSHLPCALRTSRCAGRTSLADQVVVVRTLTLTLTLSAGAPSVAHTPAQYSRHMACLIQRDCFSRFHSLSCHNPTYAHVAGSIIEVTKMASRFCHLPPYTPDTLALRLPRSCSRFYVWAAMPTPLCFCHSMEGTRCQAQSVRRPFRKPIRSRLVSNRLSAHHPMAKFHES